MFKRQIITIFVVVVYLTGCWPQKGRETAQPNTRIDTSSPTARITNAPAATSTEKPTQAKVNTPTKTILSPTIKPIQATVTPTSTVHPLLDKLPEECLYQHAEFPMEFSQENYFYNAQACKAPTLSPDETFLAYVTYERIGDTAGPGSAQEVVKLINLVNEEIIEIYRSQNFTISKLDWSSSGKLVILDASPEYVGGKTIIFDLIEMQIMQAVSGYFWTDSWNEPRTAFFTRDRDSNYSPYCKDFISGFDFASKRLLPSERLIIRSDEIIRILEGPYWIEEGRAFIFSARKSIADAELEDKTYGPSMVLLVKLELEGPRILIVKSKPEIDYILVWQEDRTYEITEELYQPLSCWDIYVQETGGDF